MPSPLINRYAVYFRLEEGAKVRQTIGRDPSLLVAVERCLATYRTTGHVAYTIEDQRRRREFRVNRDLFLRLLYLKGHDQSRYFAILNRLDREGNQDELDSFLRAHAPI